jgi:hypothetical protein
MGRWPPAGSGLNSGPSLPIQRTRPPASCIL